MSDAATARTDLELQMLESLVDCGHKISLAIGAAAMAESDQVRQLELFDAFQRGFLAVRMGIRVRLALRAAPRPAAPVRIAPVRIAPIDRLDAERLDIERAEIEPAELEKPDHGREREREREYEAVSLPSFLKTLGVVSADAARLGGLPDHIRTEALPTLDRLLARATADAAPAPVRRPEPFASPAGRGVDLLLRPVPSPPKGRLLNSTVLPKPLPLVARPRPPPHPSG